MRRWCGALLVVSLGATALDCGGDRAALDRARLAHEMAAPMLSQGSPIEPTSSGTETSFADAQPSADAAGPRYARATQSPAVTRGGSDAGVASMVRTHDAGRTPQDIGAVVTAHRDEARACYDAAEKGHPGIEGNLVMTWTINPKGDVTETSFDPTRSELDVQTLTECVSMVIKRVQFAPSPGGYETKASYPFNFRPRRSRDGGHSP